MLKNVTNAGGCSGTARYGVGGTASLQQQMLVQHLMNHTLTTFSRHAFGRPSRERQEAATDVAQ